MITTIRTETKPKRDLRLMVSQWKRRGIPYRYRAALAIEAREGGVCVPVGFLGEPEGAQ